jgi:hypothetical protein
MSLSNPPDTVGHSISTQHGYCYCVGFTRFLGLQRQHMRGTIFGIWGMTNSIRADTVRGPFADVARIRLALDRQDVYNATLLERVPRACGCKARLFSLSSFDTRRYVA